MKKTEMITKLEQLMDEKRKLSKEKEDMKYMNMQTLKHIDLLTAIDKRTEEETKQLQDKHRDKQLNKDMRNKLMNKIWNINCQMNSIRKLMEENNIEYRGKVVKRRKKEDTNEN